MNHSLIDIDRIVTEVVRRLHSTNDSAQNNGASDVPKPSHNNVEISSKLVTLACLDGRLSGVQRLIVPPRAVVTPSVRDELSKLGISLEHRAATVTQDVSQGLVLAAWKTDFKPSQLIDSMRSAGVLARCEEATPSVLRLQNDNVGKDVARKPTERVVLFTDKPALAVFHFAQRPNVRTAWAVDQKSVVASVDCLDVNVLVIEPNRHTQKQFVDMIEQYAASQCRCLNPNVAKTGERGTLVP